MNTYIIKIITAESFRKHEGFDLAILDDKTLPSSTLWTLTAYDSEHFLDFKSRLAQKLHYSPNQFRLWVLEERDIQQITYGSVPQQRKALRPRRVVPENDAELTIGGVHRNGSNTYYSGYSSTYHLTLYLELLQPEREALSSEAKKKQSMIFVKQFDALKQKLTGIGHFYVDHGASSLSRLIKTHMNHLNNKDLELYEEVRPGTIWSMKDRSYYNSCSDGDIFCFQVLLSDQERVVLERQKLYVDLVPYYDHLEKLVLVQFKPRHPAMASTIEFSLIFNKTSTYDQMAEAFSKRLQHNPKLLRFTTSHEGNPQDVIHPKGKFINRSSYYGCSHKEETVADMIKSPHDENKVNNILFYEILDLPTGEIQPKGTVKVTWTGAHNREEGKYSFLMSMTSTMKDVADKLSTMVKFSPNSSRKITLFTTQLGQIQKSFTGQEILKDVKHLDDIYAAEVGTMTLKQYDPAAMLNMLGFVTKLNVDGSNYHQWLRALESVLGMATGKVKLLTTPGHTLSDAEDLMIKQAITASVDDSLFMTVLEAESGMAAFVEIQKRYTFHSRSGHIAIMKEILETKFNMDDNTAKIASHFGRIKALADKLFISGFKLSKESFIGLFFHLSLPNLDLKPFVNLCRRIDERPGGASIVSNQELVEIAQTELDHFRLLHQNTVSGQSVLLMQACPTSLESEREDRDENQANPGPLKDQIDKVLLVRRRSFPLTQNSGLDRNTPIGTWLVERGPVGTS